MKKIASTEGVNIVISGDNSQAVKAIEDLTKAIDGVKDSKVKITADASQAIGEAGKVASTVESINDAHVNITADSSQAVDESGKASSAMENIADVHSEITADASQAVDEANKLANAEEALNDAHVEITADSSQAVGEADKAASALENINDAHTEITADASQAVDVAKKVQKFISEINGKKITFTVNPLFKDSLGRWHDIHGHFVQMGQKAGEAFSSEFSSASVQGVEKTLGSMLALDVGGKLANGFGTVLTTIASALQRIAGAVSSVMKSALAIGGGFESTITSVKIISGATENELDALIKKAREMGATLPITAKDAATAMQLLAQRGTNAKDILSAVSEVANLTISQGVDMASSADILGSTMTNFGIAVDDASKITAIFNNACNQSALSMSKLIEAMKYVGPAAGAVDMQLTEAVAAMEAIANAGLTGEMTGTGLAMVLSKLAATSDIAGVSTKNLDGTLRPLKDIFMELKANGFSLVDAIEAFGQRGSKAALALAKNSQKLGENEERLKAWGSTAAAVDAKSKTFTNTLAALQSAVEEFHIEIFEQIKDQSKDAVGGLAELTREFSKWVGETKIAGKSLNSFLQGLGFNIPSGADFKELLQNFDVQSFVDNVKDFGSTLRSIGESIAGMFSMIKTPLLWLIEYLDIFATISFWGWILGKGLQIPAAISGIAKAFKSLCTNVKALLRLSWAKLAGFREMVEHLYLGKLLTTGAVVSAAGAVAAIGIGAGAYLASRDNAKREESHKALEEKKRQLAEQFKADLLLPLDIKIDFKTGFEKLPESWIKASNKIRGEANTLISNLQEHFTANVANAIDYVSAKFPEMADSFKDEGGNIITISKDMLTQISSAMHGDEKAFEALPEHLRLVTERVNAVISGVDKIGLDLYGISEKYRAFRREIEKPVQTRFEFETGFEKLPEGLAKATDSARTVINSSVSELRTHFTDNVWNAVAAVMAKSPELADKFRDAAGNIIQINDDMLRQISSAYHGDEKAFNALPDYLQKVVEHLNAARNAASEWQIQAKKLTSDSLQSIVEAVTKKDKDTLFSEELSAGIKAITENLSAEIERANKFLGDTNGQLAVQVSLSQAHKKLDDFAKEAKKKYSIGEDIVKASAFSELERLAQAGDTAAQSLVNAWKGAGDSLDDFLANAQEAIKYLKASPAQFMPALSSMMKGIQRIDPLTGKLTEKFKKAHDALKQWSNVTFGELENRIAKIRKAFEGGFLSKSAIEAEINRVLPQIKLQVATELQPIKGQFSSENEFQSVVASELISKIESMFGEIGLDIMREKFSGMSGGSIGRSILGDVENQLATVGSTIGQNVLTGVENGIDALNMAANAIGAGIAQGFLVPVEGKKNSWQYVDPSSYSEKPAEYLKLIQSLPQNVVNAVQPLTQGLNIVAGNLQQRISGNAGMSAKAQIDSAMQKLSASIDYARSFIEGNTSALGKTNDAVLSLVNSIGTLKSDSRASFTPKDYSSEFVNVIKEIQNISSVLSALQASHNEAGEAEITNNNSIQADNISVDTGALTQAIIDGISPFISALEQSNSSYSLLSGNIQSLGDIIQSQQKGIPAVSQTAQSNNIDLSEVVAGLGNISSLLTAVQANTLSNIQAVNDIAGAVRAVESAVKSLDSGNNYDIDINQQGFMIEKKSDADMLARSTVAALRAGLGNGGI